MIEFKTIEAYNSADLDRQVNESLQEGWDIKGDILVGAQCYIQAMTRVRGKKWTN